MDASHWPLFGLTLRTERLELRMPTDDDLVGVVAAIGAGIIGDEPNPFSSNWALESEPQRTWNALAFHWRARASVTSNAPFSTGRSKRL